jgi:transposase
MVAAVRAGQSQRSVSRQFGVSLATVQLWVQRARDQPLDPVNWEDNSHAPLQQAIQTPQEIEAQILKLRQELRQHSALGEFGAQALRTNLLANVKSEAELVPSLATINRILKRHGVFDARKRLRRPPPPAGWYLPQVAAKRAEIDETDFVEDLAIEAGPVVLAAESVAALSHDGLCGVVCLLLPLRGGGATEKSAAARGVSGASPVSGGLERTDLPETERLPRVSAPHQWLGPCRLAGTRFLRK